MGEQEPRVKQGVGAMGEWAVVKQVAQNLHAAGIDGLTRERMHAGPHEAPLGLIVGRDEQLVIVPFQESEKDEVLTRLRTMVREQDASALVVLYRAAIEGQEDGVTRPQVFDTVAVVVEGGPRFQGRGLAMAQAVEWKDGVMTVFAEPHV